ncbi:hypothetical protein [Gordonibacter sp. An230]|uniref:hypothetical protein n=1 Tax=Gordonibacter sp. An230 TaxID=1965592 RepID=UPI0011221968|nr:hypothetical protein [Gordonibacter sp. An230]
MTEYDKILCYFKNNAFELVFYKMTARVMECCTIPDSITETEMPTSHSRPHPAHCILAAFIRAKPADIASPGDARRLARIAPSVERERFRAEDALAQRR